MSTDSMGPTFFPALKAGPLAMKIGFIVCKLLSYPWLPVLFLTLANAAFCVEMWKNCSRYYLEQDSSRIDNIKNKFCDVFQFGAIVNTNYYLFE